MLFGAGYHGSSFIELLATDYPDLKPDWSALGASLGDRLEIPHGTTVLGLRTGAGVLVAGDRLATEGHRVASRDIQKVFATDDHSIMAIAGAAGPAVEMARVLRVELEHYEKMEGEGLGLEGKANKLSQMIRQNLPAAMQGMVVVPLFAGFDHRRSMGRLWKFDVTGGRWEEADFDATGSGMIYARESLKKSFSEGSSREAGIRMAISALVDAADEDRGTGGVDVKRGIYPTLMICSKDGIETIEDSEIGRIHQEVMETRGVAG